MIGPMNGVLIPPPRHYSSKIFELEYGVVQFPRKIKKWPLETLLSIWSRLSKHFKCSTCLE